MLQSFSVYLLTYLAVSTSPCDLHKLMINPVHVSAYTQYMELPLENKATQQLDTQNGLTLIAPSILGEQGNLI